MAGYNSKFTGQQVDSLLEQAGSSYQKPETGIPQSDLDESTQQILQNVDNKVNKEEGKGLSTNDFTDEYKAKVEDSASQEGYFPKMSVGIAANLAGRGEATEQVFTYRPTDGGTSIESGVAKIRRVKGNSVVWNQQAKQSFFVGNTTAGSTLTNLLDGSIKVDVEGGTKNGGLATTNALNIVIGHKYYVALNLSSDIGLKYSCLGRFFTEIEGNRYDILEATTAQIILHQTSEESFSFTAQLTIIDLTQMFGAGNEPTTVEEFRALYPDSYYPYNAGELRNLVCSGIKTVGFNQWDEQWELGYYNSENGEPVASSRIIRSKNYIAVFPNTQYFATIPSWIGFDARVFFYDDEKEYISSQAVCNTLFTTPSNAHFIRIKLGSSANPVTTYNNDICINLHHTGWRDGDYEPYKEVTHALPLSQITNGEPLRKAGSVYDEINETEYIKRVGVVDLGSLTYRKQDNYPNLFIARLNSAVGADANKIANLFCSKYIAMTANDPWRDIISMGMDISNQLYIYDSQYTDIEVFKSAMSGVMLNYELAEPIVTPIETPLNLDYQAEDFGTEEALLTEDSAPFSADIVYQFNAVDRIRENSLDIEDLLARVIALENAAAATASIPDIPDITE